MPSEASRVSVQVVLRDRMSTSPDCSAVKRCCAFSGTNLTLLPSPSTAAAMALQMSTSSPVQLPWLSASEKPASPVFTPQTSWPRALMASSVLPACAGAEASAAAATNPPATILPALLIINCSSSLISPPRGSVPPGTVFVRPQNARMPNLAYPAAVRTFHHPLPMVRRTPRRPKPATARRSRRAN